MAENQVQEIVRSLFANYKKSNHRIKKMLI